VIVDPANKVVLVTGAGSGLGRATCAVFMEAGARVYGLERDAARLGEIDGIGPRVTGVAADVRDEASVRDAIGRITVESGALHVAVNCAGILKAAKTLSRKGVFPLDDWNDVIAVNLTGTFNIVRYAALAMSANAPDAATGERGVIVNVASGAAWGGQVGQAAYAASKAGVVGLTLPVARDLAEHAIRVVAVAPGLFDTAMAAGMSDATRDAILDRMVLYPKRRGRPEEFARLVRHIVENEYLNATTVSIDAGTRMTPR
jgi:NAD(P)-dependent dehydrogenase (short-subunit alcohol dehydrogenase family)